MRTLLFVVFVALSLTLVSRTAQADNTLHLPCDPTGAVSIGGGYFRGKTTSDSLGEITFDRRMVATPRLELTLFENCGRNDEDKPKVTRRWLGRLNVFGTLIPEWDTLKMDKTPRQVPKLDEDGRPILDDNDDPVMTTENTLVEADIEDKRAIAYSVGARLSLVDAKHFHVEAFVEHTSTIGWNRAEIGNVVAHVNGADLNVSEWIKNDAEVYYRYDYTTMGVTIAVPIRPTTLPPSLKSFKDLRFTPSLTAGGIFFSADVEARISPNLAETLVALNVDPKIVTARRGVEKSSLWVLGGLRADANKHVSAELSVSYGKTESTTILIGLLTLTARFDLGLEELGKNPMSIGNLPF